MAKAFHLLCVDDEEFILRSLERAFRNTDYVLTTANSGEDALRILEKSKVNVIITDYRMPGMDGVEFLKRSKEINPAAIRIMLTGFADLDVAIAAINEGDINKYMTKPWDNEKLLGLINDLRSQYDTRSKNGGWGNLPGDIEREIDDIRGALKQSKFATIKALSCAIELKDKYTKGHCERTMALADMLAKANGLAAERVKQLRYAALLHDIGKIGVPQEILNKDGSLSPAEMEIVKEHPEKGAFITSEIEFLDIATQIILEHHERIDGTGYPAGKTGDVLLDESKILAIADVFDACTSDRSYRSAMTTEQAQEILLEGRGKSFDEALVNLFIGELGKPENSTLRANAVYSNNKV